MSAPTSMPGRQPAISGTRTEQIYFTHCMPGDSWRNEAGYSIRAGSTNDAALLDFAARFTAYELPLDMWGESPTPADTPRRLAFVQAPGGLSALVHTSYLTEDTRGRKHSYFSHFLFRDKITVQQALECWASGDWTPDYPRQADKNLLEFPGGLPQPGPLDEQALTAFLNGEPPASEQPPAKVFCPSRLPNDRRRRQEMMLLALQASLLVLRAGPSAPRGRFYVLAEPGLSALLFYGAARLLPRGLASIMTFSTYENMHSALKPYRLAQLVGTWSNNTTRGLDQEYHQTRGYALDTFNDKASPEFKVNVPPGMERLIALAAEGRWATIRRAHELLGPDATTFDQLGVVLDVIDTTARLQAGQANDDDLSRLTESNWGQDSLQLHAATVWPLVRTSAQRSDARRQQFRHLLWEHRDELKGEVAEALAGAAVEPWRERWEFYKKVLQDNGAPAANDFLSLLPLANGNGPLPLAPAFRLPLLQEWHHLTNSAALSQAIVPLLTSARDTDLEPLWRSNLPAEWVNLAVISTLLTAQAAPMAITLLRSADETRLSSFLQTLRGRTKDREEPREKVLLPLAKGATPELLTRLFRAGLTGSPAFILNLLNSARVFEPAWSAYWRKEPSLEMLFRSMKEHARETGPIWKWFTDQVNEGVLSEGDVAQRELLERLEATRAALGAEVPPEVDALIRDWVMLRRHFDPSYRGPRFPSKDLRRSCDRLTLDPIDLLRADFEHFVLPQGVNAINRFEDTFHGFIPVESSFQNANTRLDAWLKVVKVCKDHDIRAGYQEYYLEKFIEPEHRLELANEAYRSKKLEKRALQKVHSLAAASVRAEEAARAAMVVPAPARLEDQPGMDPALARHLKGQKKRGHTWIVAGIAGLFLLLGVGFWWLLSHTIPSSDGEKKNADKDNRVVVRDKGRDKDGDKKADGGKPAGEVKLPDFDTRGVETLVKAFQLDVGSSLQAAKKLPKGDPSRFLVRDLNNLDDALEGERKKIPGLTILHDPKTMKGWNDATRELNDICNNVKNLADKHYELQKKLHDLLKRSKDDQPPVDKPKIVQDWLKNAPPSVLAGMVETYAIEACGLPAMTVKDKLHPVLMYYIKAAGREGVKANLNQEAVEKIKQAFLEFPIPNVLKGSPEKEPSEKEIKDAKVKLRQKFKDLKDSFSRIALGDENPKLKYALDEVDAFLK